MKYHIFELRRKIYMLFAGWEVRIVKNCDRGLENAARGRRTALRTNQIVGFVTVPTWKK